jgi:hypothetical protein
VQRQGAGQGVRLAALVEPPGDPVEDPYEVQGLASRVARIARGRRSGRLLAKALGAVSPF